MVVSLAPVGYRIELDAAEREQLVAALEFTLGVLAGDGDALRIALDLDRATLDRACDTLFLAGVPS